MRVYADNAATTKLSPAAKEAMLPYFDEIYGNPSTLYTLSLIHIFGLVGPTAKPTSAPTATTPSAVMTS